MKGRVLLLMMLSLLCAKMDARIFGAWTGEKLDVTEGNYKDYYIYAMTTDVNNRGFLSFELVDGTYKPYLRAASLVENDPNKTTVRATPTGERQNKQYVLTAFNCYQFINRQIPGTDDNRMLNCNTEWNKATPIRSDYGEDDKLSIIGFGNAHTSHFAVFETDYNDGTFFIMFQRLETNHRAYLYGNGVDKECQYWEKTGSSENQNNSWLFISEEQYTLRQEIGNKLDALEEKIKDGTASAAEEAVYNKLVANENNADITLDQLESVDALIDAAYGKEVAVEKLELEMAILDAQKKANAYTDSIGIEPKYFTNAINAAKDAYNAENGNAGSYNNAKAALNTAVSDFKLDYYYYWTVLQQAEKLGYTHNPSITGIDTATVHQGVLIAAERLRTNAIAYVKTKRYPSGTDFTLFIVNNSFESGVQNLVSNGAYVNPLGWGYEDPEINAVSDGNNHIVSYVASDTYIKAPTGDFAMTGVDGKYLFNTYQKDVKVYENNKRTVGCAIVQTISDLPKGKYRLSCLGATTYVNSSDNEGNNKLKLYANGGHSSAQINDISKFTELSTDFEISNENPTLKIKFQGESNYFKNGNWFSKDDYYHYSIWFRADNFRIEYLGDNTTTFGKNADGTADPAMADTNEEVQFEEGSYAKAESRELTVSTDEKPVWNTICLPYDCPIPDGATAKILDAVKVVTVENSTDDNIQLQFKSVEGTLQAGVPYLVKVTNSDKNKMEAENVNVSKALNPTIVSTDIVSGKTYSYGASMVGTYVKMPLPVGSYFVRSGTDELWQVGATGMTIKGYRAFFLIEKILSVTTSEVVNQAQLRMSFTTDDGEEITSIDGVDINTVPNGPVYDLTGRKISKPAKGLYIVNGKKYFNK